MELVNQDIKLLLKESYNKIQQSNKKLKFIYLIMFINVKKLTIVKKMEIGLIFVKNVTQDLLGCGIMIIKLFCMILVNNQQ